MYAILNMIQSGKMPLHEYTLMHPSAKITEKDIETIKKWNKPIIACCRSGMRSGQATSILKQHGIDCINGGGWQSLESKL